MRGYLSFVFVVHCLACFTYGDIRCHCNQPACVRSGYMCKSSGATAACYTQYATQSAYGSVDGTSDISRHGCIESLPPRMRHMCDTAQRNHQYNPNQTVVCCSDDMCNYVKNVDTNIKNEAKSNDTQTGTYSTSSASSLPNSVWFQVTVITVPIAGSIVLVFLIFMATRVLRQDTKRQRQRNEIRKQRQFKTHLLLNGEMDGKRLNNHECDAHHISSKPEKNETNSKINDLNVLEKCCDKSSSSPSVGNNNLCNIKMSYKDANINNTDQINGDKDSLFGKPFNNSLYSSLLSCGK